MTTEIKLAPTDAISVIRYSPVEGESLLLVSSWDSKLRLYDTAENELRTTHKHSSALLTCCFLRDSTAAAYAGLSNEVKIKAFDHASDILLGNHSEPVRCLDFNAETDLLLSGSWDRSVKAWDTRSRSAAAEVIVPGKVFCMSSNSRGRVVVGDSMKVISVFDVRNLSQPEEVRTNILKFQYRDVQCFPDNSGYALASIEGRVAWEVFEDRSDSVKQKKYAFKCHRGKISGEDTDVAYPVNAIAFHPIHGTFATGGGDGGVSVWDGYNKRRLWRLNYPTSVTSLAFSSDGSQLAVAASYDFSEGPKENDDKGVQISCRLVRDEDVRPRPTG
eukprot:Lankesteria_metandrocarpae@DN686_c0_g1_i1.p1